MCEECVTTHGHVFYRLAPNPDSERGDMGGGRGGSGAAPGSTSGGIGPGWVMERHPQRGTLLLKPAPDFATLGGGIYGR